MTKPRTNPHASALARLRWRGATKKDLSDFGRRGALARWGKTTTSLLPGKNSHTKAVIAHQKRYPEKQKAAQIVADALKRGELTRVKVCEDCRVSLSTHAHHEDYSKPLDVAWLCGRCHRKRHGSQKPS